MKALNYCFIGILYYMFEYLEIAIDSAIESGAKYSDARVLVSKSRSIAAKKRRNWKILMKNEKIGIGIRALVGSSWGFYSTYNLSNESLKLAGKEILRNCQSISYGFW